MRLLALAALAALSIAPGASSAQPQPAAKLAVVNVDVPVFCNAAGLGPEREQASGYAIPAAQGGGTLTYVDASRAQCHQVVGGKPTGQYRRPTICPLGSGRIQADGAWICRSHKPAS